MERPEFRAQWRRPHYTRRGAACDVRLVLHRGAKAKDASGFVFTDDSGLFKWPAPDRGVATFSRVEDIERRREPIKQLVARWIAATT